MRKIFTVLFLFVLFSSFSQSLQWIGNSSATQSSSSQNVTFYAETWEQVFGVSVEVGVQIDGSWFTFNLPWKQTTGNNDSWETTISLPSGTHQYYFHAWKDATDVYDNNGGSNYSITINANETTQDGNWNTSSNWSFGVIPNISGNEYVDVVIKNSTILDVNSTITSLSINSDASLSISSTQSLTINDALSIATSKKGKGAGTLTINSDATGTGSLITNGTVSGSATFERYLVGYTTQTDGWHFLASPVATFSIDDSDFDPGDDDDLYGWAESTGLWMNHKNGDPTHIVPGTGYFTAWDVTPDPVKAFSGTLNNDDITKSNLSFTEASDYTGWHLLGNPFPCALEWATSWSLSEDVSTTAKIWNESSASYSDIASGGTIPATQGFMVYVSSGTNSLTIPKADRIHSSQAWYEEEKVNKLKLTVYDPEGNTAQESIIKFNENATAGFDIEFDSYFLPGYAPKFYSLINDEVAVSTNSLSDIYEQLSISLGFIKNVSTGFYLEVEGVNNLLPQSSVTLFDLKTNTTQDLLENPVYVFESSEGDSPLRFKLLLSTVGIEENQAEQAGLFEIYANHQTIYLKSNKLLTNASVSVFNTLGQQVILHEMHQQSEQIRMADPGTYIVRVQTELGVQTQKVIIY